MAKRQVVKPFHAFRNFVLRIRTAGRIHEKRLAVLGKENPLLGAEIHVFTRDVDRRQLGTVEKGFRTADRDVL